MATGVAARLWRSGFPLLITEIANPRTLRRTVALSEAVYAGSTLVEDLPAQLVDGPEQIKFVLTQSKIPVLVDPQADIVQTLRPVILVDAVMAKKNIGTSLNDASLVIGLGPGFTAGIDAHAVIETKRGHNMGRVLWQGSPAPNTGVPGKILGIGEQRVIRAPQAGVFQGLHNISAQVEQGQVLGYLDSLPVYAPISGVLRGLVHDRIYVKKNMKIGDIDPRNIQDYCWTISDKALAVGGGVLEAVLSFLKRI